MPKGQKHLFILDPFKDLNLALDSSLRIAQALVAAGNAVYCAEIRHLFWLSPNKTAAAAASELTFGRTLESLKLGDRTNILLSDFDAIHMRKDPPFDLDYISATWLLDSARRQTHIFNDPEALRSFNEKLAVFYFPEHCRKALVSSDPNVLLEFIEKQASGDAVLKPLNLYGGRGVERITAKRFQTTAEILARLNDETMQGQSPRLVQPFDERIHEGEVRAFAVGGKAVAWCLKIPAAGNFLANTRAGAQLRPYEPKKEELERVNAVSTQLAGQGIAMVGFDLIGSYISEINITSPRLLTAPDDPKNYYPEVAEWLAWKAAQPLV